jgi:hypothetical protein
VRLGSYTVQVKGSSSFDKCLKLVVLYVPSVQVHFERHEEGEHELVLFVKTSASVAKYFKGEKVYNEADSLLDVDSLLRFVHGI